MASKKAQWAKQLKNLDGYKENKNSEPVEFENVPDGRYDARIVSTDLKLSKNKEQMIQIGLIIIGDSEEAERTCNAFLMLEGAGAPGGLGTIKKLGYEELPDEASDLAEIIEEIGASEKEVTIQVKGGFSNIQALLDGDPHITSDDDEDAVEESEEEETSDDADAVDVGDDVNFTFKGQDMQGTIIEILEDEDKARIKSGGKIYPIKVENISKIEEETSEDAEEVEEEPQEEPKQKPVSKKGANVAKKVIKAAPAKKATPTKKK